MTVKIHHGDAIKVMRGMADASVDSVVTDPPAGIFFMSKSWDHHKGGRNQWIVWMQDVAAECLRVCKPGAHALVWALPRTSHWTATAWENAGWEVRDRVSHIFGSGFPKSQDVGKAFDKAAGAEREVVGANLTFRPNTRVNGADGFRDRRLDGSITAPATDLAKQWDGWGTALKPAMEDWHWFKKPVNPTAWCDILREVSTRMELLLWLTAPAKLAERFLASSPSVYGAGLSGFAQWVVAEFPLRRSGTSSELTATFRSPEVAETYLSIAQSWNTCLAVLCEDLSTYTTETESGLTTALKILNSSISPITPDTIIRALSQKSGQQLSALDADRNSGEMQRWLRSIHEHTAPESVTTWTLRLVLPALAEVVANSSGRLRLIAGPTVPVIVTSNEALSPAIDDWWLLRKPLSESSIVANVAAHGTGALNIDGCRVEGEVPTTTRGGHPEEHRVNDSHPSAKNLGRLRPQGIVEGHPAGRWPANVCHDGSDEVLEAFARFPTHGAGAAGYRKERVGYNASSYELAGGDMFRYGGNGTAARFFYTAKSSREDRGEGNNHPTVKPLALMRWLCRLVTPPVIFMCERCENAKHESTKAAGGVSPLRNVQDDVEASGQSPEAAVLQQTVRKCGHGTTEDVFLRDVRQDSNVRACPTCGRALTKRAGIVLDPFLGSGSTAIAADREGFHCIGIESSAEYVEIARRRIHGDAPLLTELSECA